MVERELDALVVRAPDNVLYLTNFWGMKGYDACVFPLEGEPTLVCLEASEDDAVRTAWTDDILLFAGYDPTDPRPPLARVLELASAAASAYGRVGLELSLGTQAADRMVGEPTTFTAEWFTAFGDADATPPRRRRALKTEQEIDRMRLANDIAAAAMDHCKLVIEAGMTEAEIAAEWEGFVHGEGTGWRGKVDLALGFSLVWSGPGIRTFTATTFSPRRRARADAVRDLGLRRRLLVRPHEEPRRRRAHTLYRELEQGSWPSTKTRSTSRSRAPSLPSSTGASGAASMRSDSRVNPHTRSVTASVPAPTSSRTPIRPEAERSRPGWFLQSNQDAI